MWTATLHVRPFSPEASAKSHSSCFSVAVELSTLSWIWIWPWVHQILRFCLRLKVSCVSRWGISINMVPKPVARWSIHRCRILTEIGDWKDLKIFHVIPWFTTKTCKNLSAINLGISALKNIFFSQKRNSTFTFWSLGISIVRICSLPIVSRWKNDCRTVERCSPGKESNKFPHWSSELVGMYCYWREETRGGGKGLRELDVKVSSQKNCQKIEKHFLILCLLHWRHRHYCTYLNLCWRQTVKRNTNSALALQHHSTWTCPWTKQSRRLVNFSC